MNNTQENYYRVIKPYESNVVHSSSSLMGGASKCYKECKKVSPYSSGFSVMHMQSNKIYDFEINNIMKGGAESTVGQSEIKRLEGEIDSLKKRIVDLENKVNPPQAIPSQPSQLTQTNSNPSNPSNQVPSQSIQPQLTGTENRSKTFDHPMSSLNGGFTEFNHDLAKKFI